MAQLIDHIQCALGDAVAADKSGPADGFLGWDHYVAGILLTVEATNVEGLDPSFSFVNPYKVTGTNITLALEAEMNGTQHRTFTYAFPLYLNALPPCKGLAYSAKDRTKPDPSGVLLDGTGIVGNLDLDLTLAMGRSAITQTGTPRDLKAPLGTVGDEVVGSQIDFTVVEGIGGGPQWTLNHFKGPGGSTGSSGGAGAEAGMINFTRTAKDTLQISFARFCDVGSGGAAPADCNVPTAKLNELTLQTQQELGTQLKSLEDQQKNLAAPLAANPQLKLQMSMTLAQISAANAMLTTLNAFSATITAQQAAKNSASAAYAAAQNNNTRMLLQNLLLQSAP